MLVFNDYSYQARIDRSAVDESYLDNVTISRLIPQLQETLILKCPERNKKAAREIIIIDQKDVAFHPQKRNVADRARPD